MKQFIYAIKNYFVRASVSVLLCVCAPSYSEHQSPEDGLASQLPDLLQMIKDRNDIYKKVLDKDGMSFNTYDDIKMEGFSVVDKVKSVLSGMSANNVSQKPAVNTDFYKQAFRDGLRDPFSITPDIAIRSAQPESGSDGNSVFRVASTVQQLPKLKLRGIIMKEGLESPLALLDVAGDGVHMVRVDDEISFSSSDPNQVIKIKSINRLSVIVEVGSLGDLVVVR